MYVIWESNHRTLKIMIFSSTTLFPKKSIDSEGSMYRYRRQASSNYRKEVARATRNIPIVVNYFFSNVRFLNINWMYVSYFSSHTNLRQIFPEEPTGIWVRSQIHGGHDPHRGCNADEDNRGKVAGGSDKEYQPINDRRCAEQSLVFDRWFAVRWNNSNGQRCGAFGIKLINFRYDQETEDAGLAEILQIISDIFKDSDVSGGLLTHFPFLRHTFPGASGFTSRNDRQKRIWSFFSVRDEPKIQISSKRCSKPFSNFTPESGNQARGVEEDRRR